MNWIILFDIWLKYTLNRNNPQKNRKWVKGNQRRLIEKSEFWAELCLGSVNCPWNCIVWCDIEHMVWCDIDHIYSVSYRLICYIIRIIPQFQNGGIDPENDGWLATDHGMFAVSTTLECLPIVTLSVLTCLERRSTNGKSCPLCRKFQSIPDEGCEGNPRSYFEGKLVNLHQMYVEKSLKVSGEKIFGET